jgi:hypothetical protein
MISETRKTAAGTEYWDNEEKKVLFVPVGKFPNFEVTEKPASMLVKAEPAKSFTPISKAYEDMTVKELKAYAAKDNVNVPSDVKTKPELIKLITEPEQVLGSYDNDGANNSDDAE